MGVPGGVVNSGGLVSEGVRFVWSHRTVCLYLLSLCLGAFIYSPVSPPFLFRHDCPVTGKPVL